MKAWKKCLLIVVYLCVVVGAAISASAAGHISCTASGSTVNLGESVSLTVSLAETTVSSLGVQVTCDGMEVTSGQWLQSGLMASFDMSKNKGVFSPGSATTMSCNIFRVTLKATEPGTHSVSVKIIGKNSTEVVFEETVTKTMKVPCQTHNFGAYEKNADSHWKTCTACGHKESSTHSWDGGTVTATRTCTQIGKITYKCTICGQTRIEEQPVLAHTESGWIVDQEAQVGAEGSRHKECTVCHTVLKTESIPALTPPPTEPAPTEPEVTEPAPTEPEVTEPAPTEPEVTEPAPTEPAPTEPEVTEPAPTEPEEIPTEPKEEPTQPEQTPTEPETPATQPQNKPSEPSDTPAAPETDPETTEPATEEQPAEVPETPAPTDAPATEAPTPQPESKPVENAPELPEASVPETAPVQGDDPSVTPIVLIAAVLVIGFLVILVIRAKKK